MFDVDLPGVIETMEYLRYTKGKATQTARGAEDSPYDSFNRTIFTYVVKNYQTIFVPRREPFP